MEENVNKKNIFILFLLLVLTFLFIYKGIVLSGSEYYEAYNSYKKIVNNNSTILKKTKINDNNIKSNNKKMYELLSNFDDDNQELTSFKHSLILKHQKIISDLNILIDDSQNSNKTLIEIKDELINIKNNFNIYEKNIQGNKTEAESLEDIIDKLELNIQSMRAYFNKNNI